MAYVRFDRLVADSASLTRREAREKIKKGLCSLGGEVLSDPSLRVDEKAPLFVDGKEVLYRKFIYIMLNKPQGVISATEDSSQKTVLDLLPESFSRYNLFPVGRLDIDTEGILLLTNDGQTAHALLSPSKKVPKEYYVRLSSPLSESGRRTIERGVDIGGYITKPCEITPLSENECTIKIVEGKFHQVKRMFETVSNRVVRLKRVSFASLPLDASLAPGEYRFLTEKEVDIIGGSL